MIDESTVSESTVALASAIAEKDLTALDDGTMETAIGILAEAVQKKGGSEPEISDAFYGITQFLQQRSTDTVDAAGAITSVGQYISGGGGGGGKHSITCKIFDMETLETSDMPTTIGEAVMGDEGWDKEPAMTYIAEASGGTILACDQYNVDGGGSYLPFAYGTANPDAPNPLGADIVSGEDGFGYFFPMPAYDTIVFYTVIE